MAWKIKSEDVGATLNRTKGKIRREQQLGYGR
jgi:hypothetical protein